MNDYSKKVLNKLLDKYERSKISKGGTVNNSSIVLKSTDQLFEKYFSNEAYKYKDSIEFSLKELENLCLIFTKRDLYEEIDKVILNIDKVNIAYQSINRNNPELLKSKIFSYLKKTTFKSQIIIMFTNYIINLIESHKSTKSYFKDLGELINIIDAIEVIETLEEDILKRTLSIKLYKNSKKFEKLESKICKIYREFSEIDDLPKDDILRIKHIVNNPSFSYIKGDAQIKINDQLIDLKKLNVELSLSENAVKNLEIKSINNKKILTVENLTTFTEINSKEYLILYIGGFHNTIKRELIRKIYCYNQNLEFYHFGDIDAGGFLIHEDLESKTSIKFTPLYMNIDILKKYKNEWLSLTKNDVLRLKKIKERNSIFKEAINFMLENNCKLEQESIDLIRKN